MPMTNAPETAQTLPLVPDSRPPAMILIRDRVVTIFPELDISLGRREKYESKTTTVESRCKFPTGI